MPEKRQCVREMEQNASNTMISNQMALESESLDSDQFSSEEAPISASPKLTEKDKEEKVILPCPVKFSTNSNYVFRPIVSR